MYGKNVFVTFRGKLRTIFVCCSPNTPVASLKERALKRLQELEQKYGRDFEWAYEGMSKGYRV
ncbi:hypothetical protein [Bacillus sp. T33-2]|uniref:hypothetical protein n=1 Tax=Bacillus sp. T33-2 TaxID=2054168 RepID=UPI000C76AE95|nr:hypothetical protein [Bacillus sp. T33-2]PLR99597.1 hypothetical protein CVD19_00610 [Bacillus sp. T33-2]